MIKPLRLYLDTQDYSKMYRDNISPKHKEVLDFLLEAIRAKKIEIGYSYWNIVEFITPSEDFYRADRRTRGQFIKKLCGNNAFPHLKDVPSGAKFPNGGCWMPLSTREGLSAKAMRQKFVKLIRDELPNQSNLNRKQRRSIARPTAIRELSRKNLSLSRKDFKDLPVSDRFLEGRYLERFLGGKISDTVFEREFQSWLFDPEEFNEIIYQYSDLDNPLAEFCAKGSGSDIERNMVTAIKARRQLKKIHEESLKRRRELIDKLVDLGVEKRDAKRRAASLKIDLPPLVFDREAYAKIFGDERCDYIIWYLEKVQSEAVSFSPSDVTDLFHLYYAHDADLVRCDKKMGDIFTRYQKFEGRLVSNLLELPDKIEEKLKS